MSRSAKNHASGRFRIIGGQWRSRRLAFPAAGGVRPTPDRVRETLFNWLGPGLHGGRGLDLFAGSGALGLEGLSRGLASVTFVEQDARLARGLRENLQLLGGTGQVVQADVRAFLAGRREGADQPPFDVVFLDPPYDADLHRPVLEALTAGQWLAPDARLYVEYRASGDAPELPEGWEWRRQSRAGDVGFGVSAEC
ncbi:16S rRNA (guanine(966)-N(2))-methyltransferase RsmD [Natronospira bacteriovora]|uniref:Ribosomal RNA small subunit methyltransferase D n=1 Tax=Natronospira bacteriovora TaxID=3069753 RepID=A0ABU0WAX9_9GAMM|nr:16S rRNA (guanine(966)-N(2))-methyltransferase RsmD [Natronospira sp. AB-CW4]MDQ2070615.1 16S rRNA (guanine(966)-N(2))-methyltransferase RsmD [Natronospira sp. AB-CW4]